MLLEIPNILSGEEVLYFRQRLEAAAWTDGRVTAGELSAKAKQNLQIPQDSAECRELGEIILRALGRNPIFNSAALPLRVYPPLFNRYDTGMHFHAHVDNAIRPIPGAGFRIRTDVSSTLFLTDPEEYEGVNWLFRTHTALSLLNFVPDIWSFIHRLVCIVFKKLHAGVAGLHFLDSINGAGRYKARFTLRFRLFDY